MLLHFQCFFCLARIADLQLAIEAKPIEALEKLLFESEISQLRAMAVEGVAKVKKKKMIFIDNFVVWNVYYLKEVLNIV